MYEYEIKDRLSKKLQKVAKKDRALYEAIMKKILQVAENPYLYG
jgi:mRNA-degrading endonuclease RelE of RelBE toxin-antitoxin system